MSKSKHKLNNPSVRPHQMIDCIHEARMQFCCPDKTRPLGPATCASRITTASLTCTYSHTYVGVLQ